MYTEQDYQDISKQLHSRILWMAVPSALLAAGVIAAFVHRIQWAAIVGTVLIGFYCVFVYGLLVHPVAAYRRHLDGVLHGRTHVLTGAFKDMEEDVAIRDGVRYYPMTLSVGKMDDPNDDRLLYYDANLPRPDWQVGDMLTVTAHDKAVGKWERK